MTSQAIAWWLALEGAGLVALPIALVLFRRLPGRGYAFAKPLGLLLAGYLFWLALTFHVLPNRPGSIAWVGLLVLGIDVYIVRRFGAELRAAVEERAGYIVAVEVVFGVAFAVAAYLHSFTPEIIGTEKPMDFMLLNAASRSRFYPPDDAWLAGFKVSYYYFGYVIQAMVAKVAAVPTAVAFNLGLAGTAALATSAAFGLGYEVSRLARGVSFRFGLAVGIAALLLLSVIGNLEGVLEFGIANDNDLPARVVRKVDIANLATAKESDACIVSFSNGCIEYPNDKSSYWWWWRATRISPDANSITEFPFFSFLLGDLHPHVMALPFVLTAIAIGLALWRSETALGGEVWRRQPLLLLLLGVLAGGLGFLNTWDLPTFGALIALLVVARNAVAGRGLGAALADSLRFLAPLFVVAAVLYAPFYLSFSSQASGLDAVRGGATRPIHSALFWAPLVLLSLPLPLVLLAGDRAARTASRLLRVALLPVGLLALWVLLLAGRHPGFVGAAITDRGLNWLTALFYAAGLVAALLALWRSVELRTQRQEHGIEDDETQSLVPVLGAMAVALLLIFGSELFYINDVFGSRLNTVFKLSYQAWMLLAVSGAYSAYWLMQRWQPERQLGRLAWTAWGTAALLVLGGALLYPLGATLSRTEGLSKPGRTLDGLEYTRREQPDEFVALSWLREHAGKNERLVEGIGGQYSPAARAAAWTGIPAVLGWSGHEVQWGRDGKALAAREQDVDKLYTTPELAEAVSILRKYRVTYVYVGSVERAKYPPAGLQKFEDDLPLAFRSNQVAIYRLPPEEADAPLGQAPQ